MKKRILSIVLAVLMLVSVLPVPAMAATMGSPQTDTGAARQLSVSNATDDDSVHIVKSVNEAGTALTLEAYATNTMTTVTTYEPLDIVLVLDVSGSMRDCINCSATYEYGWGDWYWSNGDEYCLNQPEYVYERQGFAKDLGQNASPLYRASSGGYSMVEWCNGSHLFGNHQPGWYEDGLFSHSRVSDNTILYKRVKADRIKHQHRIDALKAAVGDFIDSVATQKDSEGNTIDNRISLVTFASNAKTVKGLTKASTGSGELKTALKNLNADGATQADYGMERAKLVLNGRTGEDETRKSVVILFTDGTPTSGSEFESYVASGAITAAKDLKAGGTTVFTVGIFKGANPAADPGNDNTNKYMHAVSSNYPGATYNKPKRDYEWSFGTRATGDYYLAASDANGLNAVFQAISKEVSTLAVKVDETSVLSDTLSEMFDFDPVTGDVADSITVKKVPVTGKDADGNYTWGTPEDVTGVNVSVNDKKLEVKGFDYAENAVTANTDGSYKGYKLVVTIPIKPDTSYNGWEAGTHNYPTNSVVKTNEKDERAGLTYGDSSDPQKVELNDSPEAPVTGYTVSYAYKTGTKPDNADALLPSSSVHIEGQEYNLETTPSADGWTFTGWLDSSDKEVTGKQTMGTVPVTYYGKWTLEADEPEITEAGYTVEYYRQNADGENYTLQEDTDSGVAEIGKEKTIEPAEDKYSGYTYNETKSIVTLTIQEEAGKNVFKVYYDAVPRLEVTKTITDVTRDGERLDPTDPEVEVKEGDVIEYEITVRNSGKLNLTDVVLTDEFTGAEGDLTFISGDDYTVDGYEITLKNDLNVGDSVTIKATYEVQLGDSGYEITNKASGTAKDALKREVTGESRPVGITPDALKAYWIFGSAYKYVKSKKGTFNKDGETVPFEFKVTSDKKGEEILDTFTIDVEETVKAGETSEGDWGGFDFNLSEEEFENLDKKEFNGKEYPVVYLWELKGDLKNMSYSTKRITLYLDRPNISYYSAREPMVERLGTRMAYADPDKGADADIINIYGKQSSSGGTVKVGPQLNRDDHVAYIMGYPDGTVQPEGEITRAEACTIFFRLLTDSSRDYYFSKTNDYTDVNAGDWFNNAISTLSNAGIVTGYNDGTFRPNQPITRGEMAKIIANFANLNKGTKSFTDLSGHWSKTYVELAAGNGWIAGYPDGSFRPDQKITRAETVTMINRVLERVPAKELRLLSRSIMLTFPDNNPGDWYYIAIQEASNSHEYQRSVYETTGDEMWTKLIDNVDWTKLEK